MASAESPASVLDASAVLALLNDEEGGEVVTDAIADGAAISVVNLAEVLSKVAGGVAIRPQRRPSYARRKAPSER